MSQLSPAQRTLVSSISGRLAEIPGVRGVVLGGSYARGCAQPDSDIDLGIFYSEAAPFPIDAVRSLAEAVNDTPGPVVSGFYEWGKWVNGGAWLTIAGQRLDFIYRSLEHVDRVIAEAHSGRYEIDYLQQPPFGYFSPTCLGEISIGLPLFDPDGWLESSKRKVDPYPEALRRSLIQDFLWMAEFNLALFASKFAARADTFNTLACLTRAIHQIAMALFALNRRYPLNDKTMLAEIEAFETAPPRFGPRIQEALAEPGHSNQELNTAIGAVTQILQETIALTDGLYQSRYAMPK